MALLAIQIGFPRQVNEVFAHISISKNDDVTKELCNKMKVVNKNGEIGTNSDYSTYNHPL